MKPVVLLLVSGLLAACSTAPAVENVQELGPDERVVVGRIEVMEPVDKFVTGIYGGSSLIVSDTLPVTKEGKLDRFRILNSGTLAKCGFERRGCAFRIKMKKTKGYLQSIRASSTVVLVTTYYGFPLFVEIPESKDNCTYLGTVRVQIGRGKEKTKVTVVDDFKDEGAYLSRDVAGCKPVPAIGKTVEYDI